MVYILGHFLRAVSEWAAPAVGAAVPAAAPSGHSGPAWQLLSLLLPLCRLHSNTSLHRDCFFMPQGQICMMPDVLAYSHLLRGGQLLLQIHRPRPHS